MACDKCYTCSFRDVDGTVWGFELYADSFEHAEQRLERLKANATVDGEVVVRIPVLGAGVLGRILRWMKGR